MKHDLGVRYSTFPRTEKPPGFIEAIVRVFNRHSDTIATARPQKGLRGDDVLAVLRADLVHLGFDVEAGKREADKIKRPVFFGENQRPSLQYEVDAWHPKWQVGLEIEAGRAWMSNAIYRDLIQALIMVEMDYLIVAVPREYHHQAGGKPRISKDYERTVSVADALYGHSRIAMPFSLCVVGY